jgi:hypothetical protein
VLALIAKQTIAGTLILKEAMMLQLTHLIRCSPAGAIQQGWTYVVTVAGTFFTEDVEAGDLIISKQNAPTYFSTL